jgi:uncharacterized integral membrane protein (TIGR00697 family)
MDEFRRFKHYNDLLLTHVVFALVCIPTSGKMIDVFGVPLSVSIFYFPFIYIVADVLTEVYGYSAARRVVWYGVLVQMVTTLIFSFVAWYPPSASFTQNDAFHSVLSTAPQLVLFGTIAVFLGDICNNYVLARMKVWTRGRAQGLRFVLSTIVGQGVNTAFFYTFGLWGLLSGSFLVQSIALASAVKIGVEVVMLPVTIRFAEWLKNREGVDVFDTETDFNPLKF